MLRAQGTDSGRRLRRQTGRTPHRLHAFLLLAFLIGGCSAERFEDYLETLDPSARVIPPEVGDRLLCLGMKTMNVDVPMRCLFTESAACNRGGLPPCPPPATQLEGISSPMGLSGTLPSDLGSRFPNLTVLAFGEQPHLSGRLGPLAGVANLSQVWLRFTKLSGTIPAGLGDKTHLVRLGIAASRKLSGTLPPELGRLTKMTALNIHLSLKLRGNMAAALSAFASTNRSRLRIFDVDSVPLMSGTIPARALERLTTLTSLWLRHTSVSGTLPDTFSRLTNFRKLELQGPLSGTLPAGLASNMKNLTIIYPGGLTIDCYNDPSGFSHFCFFEYRIEFWAAVATIFTFCLFVGRLLALWMTRGALAAKEQPTTVRVPELAFKKVFPRHTRFDFARLTFGRHLGRGAFGDVREAFYGSQGGRRVSNHRGRLQHKQTSAAVSGGAKVAVKTMKRQQVSAVQHRAVILECERHLAVSCEIDSGGQRHPFILQCLGWTTPPRSQDFCMVLEFAEGGSLEGYLRKSYEVKKLATTAQMLAWAFEISSAISHVHAHDILHRDISSRNVVLVRCPDSTSSAKSQEGDNATRLVAKLTDFGLARRGTRVKSHDEGGKDGGSPWQRMRGSARGFASSELRHRQLLAGSSSSRFFLPGLLDLKEDHHNNSNNSREDVMIPVAWAAPEVLTARARQDVPLEAGAVATPQTRPEADAELAFETSESSESWAFSVLLWEIQTHGAQPFADVDDIPAFVVNGGRLDPPSLCPGSLERAHRVPEFNEIMASVFWPDQLPSSQGQEKRPRFAEIKQRLQKSRALHFLDWDIGELQAWLERFGIPRDSDLYQAYQLTCPADLYENLKSYKVRADGLVMSLLWDDPEEIAEDGGLDDPQAIRELYRELDGLERLPEYVRGVVGMDQRQTQIRSALPASPSARARATIASMSARSRRKASTSTISHTPPTLSDSERDGAVRVQTHPPSEKHHGDANGARREASETMMKGTKWVELAERKADAVSVKIDAPLSPRWNSSAGSTSADGGGLTEKVASIDEGEKINEDESGRRLPSVCAAWSDIGGSSAGGNIVGGSNGREGGGGGAGSALPRHDENDDQQMLPNSTPGRGFVLRLFCCQRLARWRSKVTRRSLPEEEGTIEVAQSQVLVKQGRSMRAGITLVVAAVFALIFLLVAVFQALLSGRTSSMLGPTFSHGIRTVFLVAGFLWPTIIGGLVLVNISGRSLRLSMGMPRSWNGFWKNMVFLLLGGVLLYLAIWLVGPLYMFYFSMSADAASHNYWNLEHYFTVIDPKSVRLLGLSFVFCAFSILAPILGIREALHYFKEYNIVTLTMQGKSKFKVNLPASSRYDQEQVMMGPELGSGAFGTVFRGDLHMSVGGGLVVTPVAIKTVKSALITQDQQQDVMVECATHMKLNHPNIVRCFGWTIPPKQLRSSTASLRGRSRFVVGSVSRQLAGLAKRIKQCSNARRRTTCKDSRPLSELRRGHHEFGQGDSLWVLVELMDGGGLDTYLAKHRADDTAAAAVTDGDESKSPPTGVAGTCTTLPESWRVLWAAQIASAVAYVHSQGILHRDIAARNVVLSIHAEDMGGSGVPVAKVTDFGLSRCTGQRKRDGAAVADTYYATVDASSGLLRTAISFPWTAPECLEMTETTRPTSVKGGQDSKRPGSLLRSTLKKSSSESSKVLSSKPSMNSFLIPPSSLTRTRARPTVRATTQNDVWAFGVLLWEIETGGAVPFKGLQKNVPDHIRRGGRLVPPPSASSVLLRAMRRAWESADTRPPMKEFLDILLGPVGSRDSLANVSGWGQAEVAAWLDRHNVPLGHKLRQSAAARDGTGLMRKLLGEHSSWMRQKSTNDSSDDSHCAVLGVEGPPDPAKSRSVSVVNPLATASWLQAASPAGESKAAGGSAAGELETPNEQHVDLNKLRLELMGLRALEEWTKTNC